MALPTASETLITSLRDDLPGTLIALDFDGTLAPIVPHPADARPADGTIPALQSLAGAGAQVALITGRDARTVLALGGFRAVAGLVVAGLYGAELWRDGRLETPDEPPSMIRLRERLPRVLAAAGAEPEVWIEDKRLSLVVHSRLAADPQAELGRLREPIDALAAELELEVHPGRGVLEVRLPGYDKAGALRRLITEWHPRAVLFAGDDLGDLPAMRALAELRDPGLTTWAVAVHSTEAPEVADAADLVLDTPSALVELLATIGAQPSPPSASS